MIATRADARISISSLRNGTSLGGGLTAEILRDLVFTDGNQAAGARSINRHLELVDVNIPNGSSFSVDLQTAAAPPDSVANLVAVRLLYMRASGTNTGAIVLDPTVSDGWDTELGGTVRLEPGAEWLGIMPATAANVSGTSKILKFSNGTLSDQTLAQLVVLGATLA